MGNNRMFLFEIRGNTHVFLLQIRGNNELRV